MIVGSDTSKFVVSAYVCGTQRFVPHPIQFDGATTDTTSVVFVERRNPVMHRIGRHAAHRLRAWPSERTRGSSR